LVISLIGSRFLYYFGNYENVYKFSNIYKQIIIHPSYLQEVLRRRTKPLSRDFRFRLICEAFKSNEGIFNKKDPIYGETCLHIASKNKLVHELELMVLLGGDMSVRNGNSKNVYQYIFKYYHSKNNLQDFRDKVENSGKNLFLKKIIFPFEKEEKFKNLKRIIWRKTYENEEERISTTPPCKSNAKISKANRVLVWRAITSGHLDVLLQLFIDIYGDRNFKDENGMTFLHLAAINGDLECMRLLIDKSDINAKDNDGKTALHYASYHSNSLCVEFLVQFGADLLIEDDQRKTALDIVGLQGRKLREVKEEELDEEGVEEEDKEKYEEEIEVEDDEYEKGEGGEKDDIKSYLKGNFGFN